MVKVFFDYNDNIDYGFNIELLTKKVATEVLKLEKIGYDVSFNLSLVSKAKIKKINNSERNINKETDVLSFPNIDFIKPSDFKPFVTKKTIDVSIVDLNNKTIFLGDVVICKDVMISQAKLYGHSIKREFSFLLTHSLFHLLGYDHMNKNEEKNMFTKQDKILDKLKIYR